MLLPFIHVRLHTEYSIKDGLITISDLMSQVKKEKMPAVAITDLNNLFATIKFYNEAIHAGIKPIIGADIHFVADLQPSSPLFCLTLLCQNNFGYKNLLSIITKAYLENKTGHYPAILKSQLTPSMTEGLIALSGGMEGDIGFALQNNDIESAESRLSEWLALFPNRFYLEIHRINKQQEDEYLSSVIKIASTHHLPVVATNNIRFIHRDDFEAHEARVAIQEGRTLNDPDRKRLYSEEQYFRTQREMNELFADIPSAIQNTLEIAKRCNVFLTLGENLLPHFQVPAQYSTESYLEWMAKNGLKQRLSALFPDKPADALIEIRKPYDARLDRELAVINTMGFAGYFLIVADFIRWAKENGVPVGPGRGSGAGSLVAYSLFITGLDPLSLDLLFERFLNPERISMPDFDIDFCIEGRDRVIDYVIQTHGTESVAQIITYGTMSAKAVVRDAGRVLGLSYGFVDKIAKLIPFELGITLEKALEQEPLLNDRYQQEEEVRTLIDLALKLEGLTRNVGKHAGGIVIAPGKLTNFVPLYCEQGETNHPVTQFDKDDVEKVGLVKFDFLGLKTLTIINNAITIINKQKKSRNEPHIDIDLIPLDDPETFQLLKACQSTAVFQLESSGMRDLIKRLQPDCFEDLIALVALFRPGPLQSGMVDDFINRKNGKEAVSYPHANLESVLKSTYGVIVYQEQVMQIAQVLAGYTLGAADILRKAMGKKKPEEMAKQREIFCQGAQNEGVAEQLATTIFDLMEKFAGYGFNKSHAAAYALIAYQTAWLKTHFTAIFMSAVLTADMANTDKIIILLEDCKNANLVIHPPNINKSFYEFTAVDSTQLLYGLGAIKGIGEAAIQQILSARKHGGAFTSLFDFCKRVDLKKVNRRVLEALIKSGAFDEFNIHRASLFASLPAALQAAEKENTDASSGQGDLLSLFTTTTQHENVYMETLLWSDEERLQAEKETLGFYLSGHPVHAYQTELAKIVSCRLNELNPSIHSTAKIAGIIANLRTRQTKRGDKMAIFSLDDGHGQVDVVCFSDTYHKYRHLLNIDQLIILEGEVSIDEFSNKPRLLCREISTLEILREKMVSHLAIYLDDNSNINADSLSSLLQLSPAGKIPIKLIYKKDKIKAEIKLGKKWYINPSEPFTKHLNQVVSKEAFEWVYERDKRD